MGGMIAVGPEGVTRRCGGGGRCGRDASCGVAGWCVWFLAAKVRSHDRAGSTYDALARWSDAPHVLRPLAAEVRTPHRD